MKTIYHVTCFNEDREIETHYCEVQDFAIQLFETLVKERRAYIRVEKIRIESEELNKYIEERGYKGVKANIFMYCDDRDAKMIAYFRG